MANNPFNLALRFSLEMFALFSLGYYGWTQHSGFARLIWAVGLPLLAAILWGTFSVPGDRPGVPPVAVPGIVRLLLVEAVVFGGAVWALYAAGRSSWGLLFALLLGLHYLLSYDRVWKLLAGNG